MEALPQKELAALLGEGCFLRRMDGHNALFITDAPRRFDQNTLRQKQSILIQNGFTCTEQENSLWQIDITDLRYQQIFNRFRMDKLPAFPDDPVLIDIYTLIRLLALHPSPWHRQPRNMLREMLKQSGSSSAAIQAAPQWIAQCAILLRKHQPLPSEAAGLLNEAMLKAEKEH